MDKEKLITKIIFGVEDLSKISLPVSEEVKENFEIAWDIWENFDKIKENAGKNLLFKFLKKLKDKVEEELSIKERGFTSKIELKSRKGLYISKQDWQENYQDIGIYAIGVEKWNKSLVVGIVKNDMNFKTDKESEIIRILESLNNYNIPKNWNNGWIGYEIIKEDKEFYEKLLSDYNNLLEETFSYIKDLIGNEDLLNLFEEAVKERKEQLNKQKEKTGQLNSDGGT